MNKTLLIFVFFSLIISCGKDPKEMDSNEKVGVGTLKITMGDRGCSYGINGSVDGKKFYLREKDSTSFPLPEGTYTITYSEKYCYSGNGHGSKTIQIGAGLTSEVNL